MRPASPYGGSPPISPSSGAPTVPPLSPGEGRLRGTIRSDSQSDFADFERSSKAFSSAPGSPIVGRPASRGDMPSPASHKTTTLQRAGTVTLEEPTER